MKHCNQEPIHLSLVILICTFLKPERIKNYYHIENIAVAACKKDLLIESKIKNYVREISD